MASHHRNCHQPPPLIPTATSTHTTCYCATTTPPNQPLIDPHLLQSLISLLQSSSQNPNPNPNPSCHCDLHSNCRHTRHQIPPKDPIFSPYNSPSPRDALVSILNRIDALESSLRRRYSYLYGSSSVTETAARVIQFHFRAYLVSRSRSLRHLKDLAFIKSKFNALKSSVSDQSRFDPVVVSRKTVELLHKVDSIQDRDPMIVNGKKSLARDLVGFLDYVDAIAFKRRGMLARTVKKVSVFQTRSDREKPWGLESDMRRLSSLRRDQRVGIETLRNLYEDVEGEDEDVKEVSSEEEIPYVSPHVLNKKSAKTGKGNLAGKRKPQVGVKKNASFADDGRNRNKISICEPSSKPNAGSNGTHEDVKGILESLKKRVEEMEAGLANGVQDDEEDETESGVSAQTSDGENRDTNLKTIHQHDDDDEFTFPAPEHLKMDTKAEPTNKNLKISS